MAALGTSLPDLDPDASYIAAAATTATSTTADPDASYIIAGATAGSTDSDAKYVTALYPSEVSSEAELVFQAGDVIEELAPSDEYGWCTGRLAGITGIYPASYVE